MRQPGAACRRALIKSPLVRQLFSNQPLALEARVTVLADDDVVMHGNAERTRNSIIVLRHLNVGV